MSYNMIMNQYSAQWLEVKTILSGWKPQDDWFGSEYTMNLYRGCSFGCIYCDSRSECYHPGDFGTIRPKKDCLALLETELGSRRRKGIVATGSMSDPYNSLEKELNLTSSAMALLHKARFGLTLCTKSDLVLRDKNILQDIAGNSPVLVKLTLTCCDEILASKVEPGAPSPQARVYALKSLRKDGIFSGILFMPLLPWIQDNGENVLAVVRAAADAGANFIYPGFAVTMRSGQREYFLENLEKHFPGMGERYKREFGNQYACALPRVQALHELFCRECERLGILYEMKDIIAAYKRPYRKPRQMELF